MPEFLPVKAFRPDRKLPLPFSEDPMGNAGWDLYATDTVVVEPGDVVKVPVNLHMELPQGYYGIVTPRSGLSSQGINVIPGTIDSNYRGQIRAITQNISKEPFVVERGMRIGQIIIMKHEIPQWIEVNSPHELTDSQRGDKGFGQSGVF